MFFFITRPNHARMNDQNRGKKSILTLVVIKILIVNLFMFHEKMLFLKFESCFTEDKPDRQLLCF